MGVDEEEAIQLSRAASDELQGSKSEVEEPENAGIPEWKSHTSESSPRPWIYRYGSMEQGQR